MVEINDLVSMKQKTFLMLLNFQIFKLTHFQII